MKSRIELQMAYVLHTRVYRETSLLLDCFSHDYGKLSLIAKGARRAKSPLKGILRPFTPLLVSWVGRSELKTLTHAELQGPLLSLNGSRLASGFYLNELLMRLLHPHVGFPELYQTYQATISALCEQENYVPKLRLFEKHLLQALGYELALTEDAQGRAVDENARYLYTPEYGLSLSEGEPHSSHTTLLNGRALLALANDDLSCNDTAAQAKYILQAAIKRLLGKKPIQAKSLLIPEVSRD